MYKYILNIDFEQVLLYIKLLYLMKLILMMMKLFLMKMKYDIDFDDDENDFDDETNLMKIYLVFDDEVEKITYGYL